MIKVYAISANINHIGNGVSKRFIFQSRRKKTQFKVFTGEYERGNTINLFDSDKNIWDFKKLKIQLFRK